MEEEVDKVRKWERGIRRRRRKKKFKEKMKNIGVYIRNENERSYLSIVEFYFIWGLGLRGIRESKNYIS